MIYSFKLCLLANYFIILSNVCQVINSSYIWHTRSLPLCKVQKQYWRSYRVLHQKRRPAENQPQPDICRNCHVLCGHHRFWDCYRNRVLMKPFLLFRITFSFFASKHRQAPRRILTLNHPSCEEIIIAPPYFSATFRMDFRPMPWRILSPFVVLGSALLFSISITFSL